MSIPDHLIKATKSLYFYNKIVIKTLKEKSEEIQVNKGLKHECSLSPIIFNIYIDEKIKRWSEKIFMGIELGQECFSYLNSSNSKY